MKKQKASVNNVSSWIKEYWPVAALMVLAVIIEFFREITGVPVTILDLLFFLALLFVLFYILYNIFFKKDKKKKGKKNNLEQDESYSLQQAIGHGAVFIFIGALGAWGIWQGFYHPFKYYTGVRGNAHGYTLFVMGLLFAGFGFWGIRKSIKNYRNK